MRRVHLSWAVKQSSSPQSGSSLVFSASGLWSLLTDYCSLSLSGFWLLASGFY